MKRILALALTALGASVLLSCGEASVTPKNTAAAPTNAATNSAPATSASADADIKKLMKDIETALSKNDTDALDKVYAPDYTLTNQDGVTQTRAERLASIKSGDMKYETFSYTDVAVRPYGDTAVVTAIAHFKALSKGKPLDGDFRILSTWVKGKDGWRQVAAQATAIKEPAKTDDAKKDDMKKDDTKKEDAKKDPTKLDAEKK
jgi:ketosteroid isomerase-like protein